MNESAASNNSGPNHFLARIANGDATKDQARDTGSAVVLILLLLWMFRHQNGYITAALLAHLVTMVVPQLFRPVAVVWFGFSHLLGTIVSRVILGAIFFVVVTPVALVRRMSGADSLKLKVFKAGRESVMRERNHTYIGRDLEQPY
jgi:hypothetical protein